MATELVYKIHIVRTVFEVKSNKSILMTQLAAEQIQES